MFQLSLAPARSWKGLTVHPLLTVDDAAFELDLLDDAVAAGTLRVTEIGEGTVPALLARNDGDRDVLSPSKVRRHAKRVEAARIAMGEPADAGSLAEAQGAVWSEIADHADDLEVHSGTGDLDEVTRLRDGEVRDGIARFPAIAGQVGVLAFDGSEPLGLDAVHDRALWARLHARIVGGYVQDALGRRVPEGEIDPEAAESYLAAVRAAGRSEAPTVGGGTYRVLTGTVSGGELVDGERTVHLSAFPIAR